MGNRRSDIVRSSRKRRRKLSNRHKAGKPAFRRQLMHEALEQRLLLAGPELLAVQPNDGALLDLGGENVLSVAPRELDFLFKGGANIDEGTLDGIRITRAGADGQFDVASTRTDLGTGGQVVMEFVAANLGEPKNGIDISVLLTE
ncbi:MAG: hypothetical protein ISR77_37345, partial [Pirellulaceae bacterium]|nr:hypothetical protein [Pirellulaceae bacterium]